MRKWWIPVIILIVATAVALVIIGFQRIGRETQVAEDVPSPVVTIQMADGGVITLELYPRIAPNTVANFVTLAQSGFYDGLIFHRVIPGFMIQGGDPTGTGTGGPGYAIKGEFTDNGFPNDLSHERGVISMARAKDYDSAGSQFFIMHHEVHQELDGQYAAFGKVIKRHGRGGRHRHHPHRRRRPAAGRVPRCKSVTVETSRAIQYTVVKNEENPS